jgi:hypothetical protein
MNYIKLLITHLKKKIILQSGAAEPFYSGSFFLCITHTSSTLHPVAQFSARLLRKVISQQIPTKHATGPTDLKAAVGVRALLPFLQLGAAAVLDHALTGLFYSTLCTSHSVMFNLQECRKVMASSRGTGEWSSRRK